VVDSNQFLFYVIGLILFIGFIWVLIWIYAQNYRSKIRNKMKLAHFRQKEKERVEWLDLFPSKQFILADSGKTSLDPIK
jgi:hypothetical protein